MIEHVLPRPEQRARRCRKMSKEGGTLLKCKCCSRLHEDVDMMVFPYIGVLCGPCFCKVVRNIIFNWDNIKSHYERLAKGGGRFESTIPEQA